MHTNQAVSCIFCGANTQEQHSTPIGTVHIHSDCLRDLEEVLSVRDEELDQSTVQIGGGKIH
jgi:hypothetical protein